MSQRQKSSEKSGKQAIFRVEEEWVQNRRNFCRKVRDWQCGCIGVSHFLSLDAQVLGTWENDSSLKMGRTTVARGTQWLIQKDAKERHWISPNMLLSIKSNFFEQWNTVQSSHWIEDQRTDSISSEDKEIQNVMASQSAKHKYRRRKCSEIPLAAWWMKEHTFSSRGYKVGHLGVSQVR